MKEISPNFNLFGNQLDQYKYQPNINDKLKEKKHLQMFYKSNPDQCFVNLIESVFNDRYLYENKSFRQKIRKNKKGYVNLDEILKESVIQNFLTELNQSKPQNEKIIELIKKLSTKLICNHNQVRRKYQFVNKIKNCKPVYIQQYPENDGNEALQTLLQSKTNIYRIHYNHKQNWAYVYAQDSNKIIELNGYQWNKSSRFHVMSYQKSLQSFQNLLGFDGFQIKSLYRKSSFEKFRDQIKYKNPSRSKLMFSKLAYQMENQSQDQQQALINDNSMDFIDFSKIKLIHQPIDSKLYQPNLQFNKKCIIKPQINTKKQDSHQQYSLSYQLQTQIDNYLKQNNLFKQNKIVQMQLQ